MKEFDETIEYSDEVHYKNTRGQKRFLNHFLEIIRTDRFIKQVVHIRKTYSIPITGYDWFQDWAGPFAVPPDWINTNKTRYNKFYSEVGTLSESFDLYGPYWENIFVEYIWWNEILGLEIYKMMFDMCIMEDEILKSASKSEARKINKMYPVTLKINPYASIRDIVDYVNKNSSRIKQIQNQFKLKNSRIEKVRSKDKDRQKWRDYIYANRNLPVAKIRKLLSINFKLFLDDGHISKIISIEKNRRCE